MNIDYENEILSTLKAQCTDYAIITGGRRECIPDTLTMLCSLKKHVPINLYTVIYFYSKYNNDELNLIRSIFPEIILIDIDKLSFKYTFLKSFSLLCNNTFGSPLGAKFFSFKLLKIFKFVVHIDRDTIIFKDFTDYIHYLDDSKTDISVLKYSQEFETFFKFRIEKNREFIKEYLAHTQRDTSNTYSLSLTSNGIIFFSSSLLSKIDINTVYKDIEELCQFAYTKGNNNFTDEEILCFIINNYTLAYKDLPLKFNFITGLTSVYPKNTINEAFRDLRILHLSASDKRSPLLSCFFPEIDAAVTELLGKIKMLPSSVLTSSTDWIIKDLMDNSYLENPDRRIEIINSYRNFYYIKEQSHTIDSFIKNSHYFYSEKLANNEVFMLFIKNIRQHTRLTITPCFFTLSPVKVTLRIHYSPVYTRSSEYLEHFNNSVFKQDFETTFIFSNITHDDAYFYLTFYVSGQDLLPALYKLEKLFVRNEDELFLSLFS